MFNLPKGTDMKAKHPDNYQALMTAFEALGAVSPEIEQAMFKKTLQAVTGELGNAMFGQKKQPEYV
jgi:hypothetical protein